MADYDWFSPEPKDYRLPIEERGQSWRWDGRRDTNDKNELLARELMALQRVVKKLAEDLYPIKTVSQEPDHQPTNEDFSRVIRGQESLIAHLRERVRVLEAEAATNKTVLDKKVEELTNSLAEERDRAEDWQAESETLEVQNEELAKKLEAAEDLIAEFRSLLK